MFKNKSDAYKNKAMLELVGLISYDAEANDIFYNWEVVKIRGLSTLMTPPYHISKAGYAHFNYTDTSGKKWKFAFDEVVVLLITGSFYQQGMKIDKEHQIILDKLIPKQ